MHRAIRKHASTAFLGSILALSPTLSACTAKGPVAAPADPTSHSQGPYRIGIPDQLRIVVWKYPDLSVEAPVRRDGKISVPLVEDVQAAGLTPEELADRIAKELDQYVSRPDVTVMVLGPESQVVTVMGGVQQSGPVPIRGAMGVAQAIGAAGGFTPWANKSDIRVIRVTDGKRASYRFSYKDYLDGDAGADILLEPGDVIMVPE